MNNYYVYLYWRLDTNEPFYVGMGHGGRWRNLSKRNNHFKNTMNKCNITVEIIKDNLTEEQAHGIEIWLINELVFEYGFSIDIPNNRSREKGFHLVNMTWGGEGTSGYNQWENLTDNERNEYRNKISKTRIEKGVAKGEKNPFYGRNFKESMSEETYELWVEKHKIKNSGKNNPMYGKHGKDNKNSKSVMCLTTEKVFYSTVEAGKYYKCDPSGIAKCCRRDKNKQGYTIKTVGKYNGTPLKWMYLSDFLSKCTYTKL